MISESRTASPTQPAGVLDYIKDSLHLVFSVLLVKMRHSRTHPSLVAHPQLCILVYTLAPSRQRRLDMIRWNWACIKLKASAIGTASKVSPALLLSPSAIVRRQNLRRATDCTHPSSSLLRFCRHVTRLRSCRRTKALSKLTKRSEPPPCRLDT